MQLPFGLDVGSFLIGAGFVFVLAFVVFVVNVWWRDATSPFRPQVVAQTTKRTPSQVTLTGIGAFFQFAGAALLVSGVLLLVVFGASISDVRWLGLAGIVSVIIGSLIRLAV